MLLCRPLLRCLRVLVLALFLAAAALLLLSFQDHEKVEQTERQVVVRLQTPSQPKSLCVERRFISFVKVHKCASSAIGTILVLFGLKHKLNFALPRYDQGHLGWPAPLRPEHLDPHVAQPINIITHHMVYNRTTLKKLMPSDTTYIAILREPYFQFKSAFNFFLVTSQLDMTSKSPMTEFLENPRKFEKPVHFIYNGKYFGAKSITRNFMLTDLGFSSENSDSETKIREYIDYLDDNFDLIMIKEYLLESLVLMRRLLCWDIRDVICRYVNRNKKYKYRPDDENEEKLMKLYNEWSKGDVILYDHFNKTLWKKISNEGRDFWRELDYFSGVLERVDDFCKYVINDKNITKEEGKKLWTVYLHIQLSDWNEPFTITKMECIRMSVQPWQYTKSLRKHMKWKDTLYEKDTLRGKQQGMEGGDEKEDDIHRSDEQKAGGGADEKQDGAGDKDGAKQANDDQDAQVDLEHEDENDDGDQKQ
ncbi:galactosylceramide sulfotransferase-like [Lineus longissimus]|uniref:galactosylceramide sulfotransferase-like n=1 Tax=Lineus longissimus TaxID=88925 RepID=UPI00315C8E64